MVDFETAASELSSLDEEGLSRVSKLAQLQQAMEQRIADLEQMVKDQKKLLREVQEDQLPAAMAEHGITKLELEDGSSVSVGKFYSASIPKDRADQAFMWLVDNGYGDLIKNQVSTSFVRGQEEKAEEFAKELEQQGHAVSTRKWVEPMTLKAFVKDQTEQGVSIPDDLFGVYIGEKTKISTPKKGN